MSSLKDTTDLRLRGKRLLLAKIVWIAIVVPAYILFIVNIPAYFAALHTLRPRNLYFINGQIALDGVHTLQSWGLSLDFYAFCMVAISAVFQFSYAIVGVLLFWRRSDYRIALLTSFALMMLPFGFASITLQALPSFWSWIIPTLSLCGNTSVMLCLYILPDGRFVPQWTRWLTIATVIYWSLSSFFPSVINVAFVSTALIAIFALSAIGVQIYRYRYVSTLQQRQQTKWVVFGAIIATGGDIGTRVLYYFVVSPLSQKNTLADAFFIIFISLSLLIIPPTLSIAILRSRLWDIDVIINRALVYSLLSLTLILVYLGLVFGLQALLSRLFTSVLNDSFAVVISTLSIAALFQPLRHRIQHGIDRRFFRHKYDARRIIVDFSNTVYDEVDLEQLCDHLVGVVEQTMQPTHVSLWLRPSVSPKKRLNP